MRFRVDVSFGEGDDFSARSFLLKTLFLHPGLVKGLGILSLKQLDIMTTLSEAIQNKKSQRHREGALFGFEMLCAMLGRLFEPYVVGRSDRRRFWWFE